MAFKKIIPIMYLKDGNAYRTADCNDLINSLMTPVEIAVKYSENGADEIILNDLSYDDESHEEAIGLIRQICKAVDTPVIAGGNVKRAEDVKKYLYAGAAVAFLEDRKESNLALMKEVSERFGNEKIALMYSDTDSDSLGMASEYKLAYIISDGLDDEKCDELDFYGIPFIAETGTDFAAILSKEYVGGITGSSVSISDLDFMALKTELTGLGVVMNTFESSISFDEFKTDNKGLIPVIVQDYKTDEVLMLAYMNQEAYDLTIATGRMTYYSRSRQEIWVKGLTSGHFQYVRSIEIDCDNDTLLAKVKQTGAACHTGNRSCFYRNLVSSEYQQTNPLKVFNEVMSVIEDRKNNPKEGSYTNYLFEKGIDKILKKVGEEASEIIIAAKNPDPEEIKYEISDFLYHVMVLMALKDVSWEDIVKELANR